MSEQLPLVQPSPSAGLYGPSPVNRNPFPEGWGSVKAVPLGDADEAIPVKPDLYARWVRYRRGENQDNTNYHKYAGWGFVKCEKAHLTRSFKYWDDNLKAFLNGDLIAMVCPRVKALSWMKANYEAANNRVSNHFIGYQNQRYPQGQNGAVAKNYIPEVKWDGPQAHFPEDEGPKE